MTKWLSITLSTVCSNISYGFTASANFRVNGPKFLRITDIVPKSIDWESVPFCQADEKIIDKYRLKNGDIVIARTGANTGFNKTIKNLERDAIFASYLIRYEVDREKANAFYVGYAIQSPQWYDYIDAIAGGSAQPGANASQLGSFSFLLPPTRREQDTIVCILTSLDDKIDLLHRQNKTLEAMGETLFRQWFVEDAQESWIECSVSDFADHAKENVIPQNHADTLFSHYSIPAFDNERRPTFEPGREILSNKFKVLPYSILVSKLNPRTPRIWPICELSNDNSICSTEFQVIKPKNQDLFGFILFLLRSNEATDALIMAASGTSGSHQRVRK